MRTSYHVSSQFSRGHFAASLLALFFSLSFIACAAPNYQRSTSNWIKIAEFNPRPIPREVEVGTPNSTYMTVTLVGAYANAKDNWWNRMVKTNSNIVIGVRLKFPGGAETVAVSEALKVSSPENFQYPTNRTVIGFVPLSRSDYNVALTISHLADDGVAEMINTLKTSLPTAGLTVSNEVVAGVSLGKTVLDALFKRQLAQDILSCPYQVNDQVPSGVYAIFAGNDATSYARYTETESLRWKNNSLQYREKPTKEKDTPEWRTVSDCSYMVVRLSHTKHLYPTEDSVYDSGTQWGKLYLKAKQALAPLTLGLGDSSTVTTVAADRVGKAQGFMNSAVEVIDNDAMLSAADRRFITEDLMYPALLARAKVLTEKPAAIVAEFKGGEIVKNPAESNVPKTLIEEGVAVARGNQVKVTAEQAAALESLHQSLSSATLNTLKSFSDLSGALKKRGDLE